VADEVKIDVADDGPDIVEQALNRLARIIKDDTQDPKVHIAAAELILKWDIDSV
jgi:hypothetical protein